MRHSFSAETVIDVELRASVERAMGLEQLRAGRHVLRDAKRHKVGEMTVRRVWTAEIRPPASPAACLSAVVCDPQTTLVLAVPEVAQDRVDLRTIRLRQNPDWSDPVADVLASLDLWSGGNEIPFGGYSYRLFVQTPQLGAAIMFGNPHHPRRVALQDALLEVARLFVTADTGPSTKAFVERWETATKETMPLPV